MRLILLLVLLPVVSYSQVDYGTQIQPIFNNNCVSCHGGTNGVTLETYQSAIASFGQQYGKLVISPGDADASPLYNKISNASPQFGNRMPNLADPLTANEISLIMNWINEGANQTPTSIPADIVKAQRVYLDQNYPNPFNPSTQISFYLPESQEVKLSIYNLTGQLIETLSSGKVPAGIQSVTWNGKNSKGIIVPSGIYLYQLTTGSTTWTRKMILTK